MWLPKNERVLLRFYYSKIGDEFNGRLDLDKEMLVATMKLLNSYSKHIEDICAELEIMKSLNFKKVNDARQKGAASINAYSPYSITGLSPASGQTFAETEK